jgi:hypothetical protein
VRSIGVTEVTYYRWRQEFGGLRSDQVKRLKVDELLRAEVERLLTVGGASGADDVGAVPGRGDRQTPEGAAVSARPEERSTSAECRARTPA